MKVKWVVEIVCSEEDWTGNYYENDISVFVARWEHGILRAGPSGFSDMDKTYATRSYWRTVRLATEEDVSWLGEDLTPT